MLHADQKPFILFSLLFFLGFIHQASAQADLLERLDSPILFQGNDTTAYRDPAVLYHNKTFYLFFTLVKTENGKIYSYTAQSHSTDLIHWSPEKIITPKDQTKNYCSPGNIIRFGDEWILCLQTYPRPDHIVDQGVRYGSKAARLFIMRSKDLENWSEPELVKVKGPEVKMADIGRMIDPLFVRG